MFFSMDPHLKIQADRCSKQEKYNLIKLRIGFSYVICIAVTNELILQYNFMLLVIVRENDLLYNIWPPTDCTFVRVSLELGINATCRMNLIWHFSKLASC